MDDARLRELIQKHFDQSLAPSEQEELDRLLSAGGRAAELFWQEAEWHVALQDALAGPVEGDEDAAGAIPASSAANPARVVISRTAQFFARPTPLSMSVAALVIGLLITAMAFMAPPFYRALTGTGNSPSAPEVVAARVTKLHEVVWADGALSPRRGTFLAHGRRLAFESGLVELTFVDGAQVIIEGPARFNVDSAGLATLESGKVVARVPPEAVGFTVDTPLGSVVDLGTQFALDVDQRRGLELHMLAGRAELRTAGGQTLTVVAGEAMRVDAKTLLASRIPVQAEAFTLDVPSSRLPAKAQFHWIAQDGAWETPDNWEVVDHPGVKAIPREGDRVYIDNGGTARFGHGAGEQVTKRLHIGFDGTDGGTLIQDGGSLTVWPGVLLGGDGAAGSYVMDGGTLTVAAVGAKGQHIGTLNVGAGDAGGAGPSIFTQNRGRVLVHRLKLATGADHSHGRYEMNGGRLTVTDKFLLANDDAPRATGTDCTGVFRQTGGQVDCFATVQLGLRAGAGGEAVYELNGGALCIHNAVPFAFSSAQAPAYFSLGGGELYLPGAWDFDALLAINRADVRVAGTRAKAGDLIFEPTRINGKPYTRIKASST